jgi:hypothetical protein
MYHTVYTFCTDVHHLTIIFIILFDIHKLGIRNNPIPTCNKLHNIWPLLSYSLVRIFDTTKQPYRLNQSMVNTY